MKHFEPRASSSGDEGNFSSRSASGNDRVGALLRGKIWAPTFSQQWKTQPAGSSKILKQEQSSERVFASGLCPVSRSQFFTKYSSIEFSSLPLCTNNDGLVIGRRAWNRALFKSIPDPNYILHLTYGEASRRVGVEPSSAYSALSSSGTFQIT
jgi:hypothetical protein